MYTYFAMPRSINLMHEGPIQFPARTRVIAKLGPRWLFGCDANSEDRRSVLLDSKGVSIIFNSNTGKHSVKGGFDIPKISASVSLEGAGIPLVIDGDEASVEFDAHSYEEVAGVGNALAYALPAALNAFLQTPAVVESITARTGTTERGYQVWNVAYSVAIVSETEQNARAAKALSALPLFSDASLKRLQAALLYFYRAARLAEAGNTRWEFLSESILNLAKSLEALFPKSADVEQQDAAREGLKGLGIPPESIETWFIPALILRNRLDVGHVRLALLGRDEIPVLTQYAERAIGKFRELFQSLIEKAKIGELSLSPYTEDKASSAKEFIARIHAQMKSQDPSVA